MTIHERLMISLLCMLFIQQAYAQGCSDAGFCTIGNLTQQRKDSISEKHLITLLLPIGKGDEGVLVFTPGIQYDHQLSQRWALQAKLTANDANGKLGRASGPGDFYLSGTHTLYPRSKWKASVTIGTKLPLNQGNLKEEGKALPMQYQSSLGTIDVITGFAVSNKAWLFSAGWQQPVSGINRNNFLPVYWNKAEANKYPPSNDFNRKGDVLFRVAYNFELKRKFSFSVGCLSIYHLAEDTYIDANLSNDPIAIKGSQGFTINATVLGFWQVNSQWRVGFSAGAPLVYREVRPDGLTRSFVFAPEIRWSF